MNRCAEARPGASAQWLVSFPAAAQAMVDLVCFPHAGGGTVTYHPWSHRVPSASVHAVLLPGRESRIAEAPARRFDDVVEPVAAALAAVGWTRPLVLFGHSFGALLAYEVARRLTAMRPRPLAMVIVSGRPAPHLHSRAPRLAHLEPRDVVFRVADLYRGIPSVLLEDGDLVALMGVTLKADLTVLESYRHTRDNQLECPIVAVGGIGDPLVSGPELEAWAAHTQSRFSSVRYPGGHFYLQSGPGQEALLAEVHQRCANLGEAWRHRGVPRAE